MPWLSLVQAKREDFRRGYSTQNLIFGAALPVVASVAAMGINQAFDGGVTRGGLITSAIAAALVPIQIALLWLTKRSVDRSTLECVPAFYVVQATAQNLWMCMLAWVSVPVVSLLSCILLIAAAFNDSRYFYAARWLRLQYFFVFPILNLVLLMVDLTGGDGVLSRYDASPSITIAILWVQVLLAIILQSIIVINGKQSRNLDEEILKAGRLEKEHALLLQEQELMRRTTSIIISGFAASQFAHDVASPISVIKMGADHLAAMPTLAGEAREVAEDMLAATETLLDQTSTMALAIKHGAKLESFSVDELIDDALIEATQLLHAHQIDLENPIVDLAPAELWLSPGHTSAVANVISNGQIHAAGQGLAITGRSDGADYYVLDVRDAGVKPHDRPQALTRIKASLDASLGANLGANLGGKDGRDQRYERTAGYGISLMLSRLLIVRAGGMLEAVAPDDARPGLILRFKLPRVVVS